MRKLQTISAFLILAAAGLSQNALAMDYPPVHPYPVDPPIVIDPPQPIQPPLDPTDRSLLADATDPNTGGAAPDPVQQGVERGQRELQSWMESGGVA